MNVFVTYARYILILPIAAVLACGNPGQRPSRQSGIEYGDDNTQAHALDPVKDEAKNRPDFTGGYQPNTEKRYTTATNDSAMAIVKGRINNAKENLDLSTKVYDFKVSPKGSDELDIQVLIDEGQRKVLNFKAYLRTPKSKKYKKEATGVLASGNPNYDLNVACEDDLCQVAVLYLNRIEGKRENRKVLSRAGMIYREMDIFAELKIPKSKRDQILKLAGVNAIQSLYERPQKLKAITREVAFGRSKYSVQIPMLSGDKLCLHFDLVDTESDDEEVRVTCKPQSSAITGGRLVGNSNKGDILLELDLGTDLHIYFNILKNEIENIDKTPSKVRVTVPAEVITKPAGKVGDEDPEFFVKDDQTQVEELVDDAEKTEEEKIQEKAVNEAVAEAEKARDELEKTAEEVRGLEEGLKSEREEEQARAAELEKQRQRKEALEQKALRIQKRIEKRQKRIEVLARRAEEEEKRRQEELAVLKDKAEKEAIETEKAKLAEEARQKEEQDQKRRAEESARLAELKKREDQAKQVAAQQAEKLKKEQERLAELQRQREEAKKRAEEDERRIEDERKRVQELQKKEDELKRKAEEQKKKSNVQPDSTFLDVNSEHPITKLLMAERDYHRVQKMIAFLKTNKGQKNTLQMGIDGIVPKWDVLAPIFQQTGAPSEFIGVSLKESPYFQSKYKNPGVSSSGALGPWQFVHGTAKSMGLKVYPVKGGQYNRNDERLDLSKSTRQALTYLLNNVRKFDGDVLLAFAGYNAGPGYVQGRINRISSKEKRRLEIVEDLDTKFRVAAGLRLIASSVVDYATSTAARCIILTNPIAHGFTIPKD